MAREGRTPLKFVARPEFKPVRPAPTCVPTTDQVALMESTEWEQSDGRASPHRVKGQECEL